MMPVTLRVVPGMGAVQGLDLSCQCCWQMLPAVCGSAADRVRPVQQPTASSNCGTVAVIHVISVIGGHVGCPGQQQRTQAHMLHSIPLSLCVFQQALLLLLLLLLALLLCLPLLRAQVCTLHHVLYILRVLVAQLVHGATVEEKEV